MRFKDLIYINILFILILLNHKAIVQNTLHFYYCSNVLISDFFKDDVIHLLKKDKNNDIENHCFIILQCLSSMYYVILIGI